MMPFKLILYREHLLMKVLILYYIMKICRPCCGVFVHDISGVDVLVADCDYEAAMQLLRQNQMIPEEQKFCPFCGSDRIKFVLKKEHRVRAVSAAIVSMLATVPPGGNHWEYICDHCGKAFEKPVTEFNPSALEEKD